MATVAAPAPARRLLPSLDRVQSVAVPLGAFVTVLVLVEAVVRLLDVQEFIFPAPSTVFATMWTERALILPEAAYTVTEMIVGFAIAVGVGVGIALWVTASTLMGRTVYPLLIISQVVPSIALAPIFLIWFGTGVLPKILLVALISFFPIVVNTAIGLRSLEREKVHLARTMGAGGIATFVRFRLPNALPSMFAGLKLGATATVIGAVVGEFMGGDHGLGFLMLTANGSLNTPLMFASIGYTAVIGLGFFGIVALVERLTIPWYIAARAVDGHR
ncbi:ABC transporter permease [Pseudonocardia sp. NPDC049635]|uniref:ABC transporter permease n=1 Tax=Pseudonocardia sp. NPDC049635 TaxID=3155506 RepID=UPI0033DA862A